MGVADAITSEVLRSERFCHFANRRVAAATARRVRRGEATAGFTERLRPPASRYGFVSAAFERCGSKTPQRASGSQPPPLRLVITRAHQRRPLLALGQGLNQTHMMDQADPCQRKRFCASGEHTLRAAIPLRKRAFGDPRAASCPGGNDRAKRERATVPADAARSLPPKTSAPPWCSSFPGKRNHAPQTVLTSLEPSGRSDRGRLRGKAHAHSTSRGKCPLRHRPRKQGDAAPARPGPCS